MKMHQNKWQSLIRRHKLFGLRGAISLLILFFNNCLQAQESHRDSFVKEGIKVEFSMEHVDVSKTKGNYTEGDDIVFRFELSDTLTNQPVTGANPAAWLDLRTSDEEDACGKRIATFISGDYFNKAELDLNTYYVLTLNQDNTITVIDPLYSFNGSQLLAYIQLNGTGYDWKSDKEQKNLYISVPSKSQLSIVSTSDWDIVKHITVPGKPQQVKLQPDEQYVWVAFENMGKFESSTGVSVINRKTNEIVKNIHTGNGKHWIEFDENNQYAFVSNQTEGTVSVINIQTLQIESNIKLSGLPVSMAYSQLSQALYVLDRTNATLHVIDGKSHEVVKTIDVEPGCHKVQLDPTGRLGFLINPETNKVHILSTASNQLVQTADVEDQPDEIAFTDRLAYVKHRNSEIVWMLPLEVLGRKGQPVSIIDFPGGENPPSNGVQDCIAPAIAEVPGSGAVLVSNYKDKTTYFYAEGMAAPMGNFMNYGKFPKGVMVIDRSLDEKEPGVYETVAQVRSAGDYNVAMFLDVPSIMHCFPVHVKEDEELKKQFLAEKVGALAIQHLPLHNKPIAGEGFNVRFKLIELENKTAVSNLEDVQVMSMKTSGTDHNKYQAKETEEPGIYEANLSIHSAGLYYFYIACPSRGLSFNNPQFKIVKIAPSEVKN